MDLPAPPAEHDISRVYEAHFEYVWHNLRRLGVESADVEDAVHDVFVVAHRRRHAFRGASSMRTWLFGIARRVARDHRRRRSRHRRRLDAVGTVALRHHEPDQERAAGSAVLHRFLDSLDEGKRSVFILVELEQMTGREVADALQINPNTAAARLRAARKAFDAYARDLRDADRMLGEPPPVPESSRRRAWSLVVADLGLDRVGEIGASTGGVGLGATSSAVVYAKAVAATLVLAAGGLGAITAVARVGASDPVPSRPKAVRSVAEAPSVSEAPSVVPSEAGPSSPALVSAAPEPARASPRPAAPKPKRAVPRATASADALAEHNRRLAEARAALAGDDAAGAQALAEDYLRLFEAGFYADEMTLVRIQALAAQGRCGQAKAPVAALVRRRPGTTLARLASAACPSSPD